MSRNGQIEDLTGRRYGRLVVLEPASVTVRGHMRWLCRCWCGNETLVFSSNLKSSNPTRSCGCLLIRDLSGQRIGPISVISRLGGKREGFAGSTYECKCDCGRLVVLAHDWLKAKPDGCGKDCRFKTRPRITNHLRIVRERDPEAFDRVAASDDPKDPNTLTPHQKAMLQAVMEGLDVKALSDKFKVRKPTCSVMALRVWRKMVVALGYPAPKKGHRLTIGG